MLYFLLVAMALITQPLDRLSAAGEDAWRPRPRPLRSQWCCENIRLPSETGAQPGPFDLTEHAYMRGIIDAVDDWETSQIVLIGCTQIGKTEMLKAIILSQGEVARAPMMFAGPDQPYIREERQKIYRTAEASPALADRLPPERLRNDRWIDLERCLVYLAWSGSTQRLSGRSCRLVLCSEVDRWQNDPKLAGERVKAFPGGTKVLFEGTPVGASAYLDGYYKQSDRRTFRVKCPICGRRQELRFFPHRGGPFDGRGGVSGLKDAAGNWLSPDAARRSAFYLCETGCHIEPSLKNAMVRGGVWAPDGCDVDADGCVTGTPRHPGRRAGFRLNSLYSARVSIGDMAEEYLLRRDNEEQLKQFFNDWLGLAWIPRGSTPRWRDLGIRLAGVTPRGIVPRGAYFLTAGSDVQLRGVYWIVRAWGDGKTSWLVDWGFLPKVATRPADPDDPEAVAEEELASDLAQLNAAVLTRRFDVDGENPLGFSSLAVRLLGVDRGYRQTDTDSFVAAHPGGRVVAVYGDPKIVPGTLYRPIRSERNARTGRVYADGVECWGIETNAYKTDTAARWSADRRLPGSWWLPMNILETDGGEDYLRQVTAETRKTEVVNGRKVTRWALISKEMPNHDFDCEVYASALADMVVGRDWDASKWPWLLETARAKSKTEQQQSGVSVREFSEDDFSAR